MLAGLSPEVGPDRPDLARYFVSDPNFPVATHPGPFRGRNAQKLVSPGARAWTRDLVLAWPRVRPRAWAQGLA